MFDGLFSVTFNRLKAKNRKVYKLFYVLTCLKGNYLSEDMLARMLKELGGEVGTLDLILSLKKYSLINHRKIDGKDYYYVHDVIADRFNKNYPKELKIEMLRKYQKLLVDIFNQEREDRPLFYPGELIQLANLVVDKSISDEVYASDLVELMISLLDYNNILFYKLADYKTYQRLSEKIYPLLMNKDLHLSTYLKSMVNIRLIFADFIYEDSHKLSKLKKQVSTSLEALSSNSSQEYLANIYLAQFYLFSGNLEKAEEVIENINSRLDLSIDIKNQIQMLYTSAWVKIESGKYKKALEAIKDFEVLSELYDLPILPKLYIANLKARSYFEIGSIGKASEISSLCIRSANHFFQSEYNDVSASSYITLGKAMKKKAKYAAAVGCFNKAIRILSKLYEGSDVDFSQADCHFELSKAYTLQGYDKKAIQELNFVENYYRKMFKADFMSSKKTAEVISALSKLYAKTGAYTSSASYFVLLTKHSSSKSFEKEVTTYYREQGLQLVFNKDQTTYTLIQKRVLGIREE